MEASGWLLEAKTVKQKVRRHRGGSVDERVGSDVVSLQRPTKIPVT